MFEENWVLFFLSRQLLKRKTKNLKKKSSLVLDKRFSSFSRQIGRCRRTIANKNFSNNYGSRPTSNESKFPSLVGIWLNFVKIIGTATFFSLVGTKQKWKILFNKSRLVQHYKRKSRRTNFSRTVQWIFFLNSKIEMKHFPSLNKWKLEKRIRRFPSDDKFHGRSSPSRIRCVNEKNH